MAASTAITERRPCQVRAFDETTSAIDGGAKRVCVTSPTGSGKSLMQAELLEWAREAALLTNRRILREQLADHLRRHEFDFGCIASGEPSAHLRPIQLCMVQTLLSRIYRNKSQFLPTVKVVAIDEAHSNAAETVQRLATDWIDEGAAIVGYTATPLDIGHMYDELIVAGTVSECLERGELVGATVYAPDEPELKHIKRHKVGEDLTEGENIKAIMVEGIFGRVVNHFNRLNPDRKPTILFAPGVGESIWFAQQFTEAGIRAASIDGDNVWIDGEFYQSSREARDHVASLNESGDCPVVCNRFVLREGVDWPWLAHGILATVFGSLTSYIQSCGRLLRCYPGLDRVTIQDHGGNWHRHGPIDVDREWSLSLTNHMAVGLREQKLRDSKIEEPITCPKCFAVRWKGNRCPDCGFITGKRMRIVVQANGQLKAVDDKIYKPRRTYEKPDVQRVWDRSYHQAKNSRNKMTFNQAAGYFAYNNYFRYPPRNLKNMPINELDWFLPVADVPKERLR